MDNQVHYSDGGCIFQTLICMRLICMRRSDLPPSNRVEILIRFHLTRRAVMKPSFLNKVHFSEWAIINSFAYHGARVRQMGLRVTTVESDSSWHRMAFHQEPISRAEFLQQSSFFRIFIFSMRFPDGPRQRLSSASSATAHLHAANLIRYKTVGTHPNSRPICFNPTPTDRLEFFQQSSFFRICIFNQRCRL